MTAAGIRYRGGHIPYGYARSVRRLQPVPAEQVVIEAARALHAGGRSFRTVAGMLGEMGLTARNGSPWHPEQVRRLCTAQIER